MKWESREGEEVSGWRHGFGSEARGVGRGSGGRGGLVRHQADGAKGHNRQLCGGSEWDIPFLISFLTWARLMPMADFITVPAL